MHITVNYPNEGFLENVWPFLQAAAYDLNGTFSVSFDGKAIDEGGNPLPNHVQVVVESNERDFGPFWTAFERRSRLSGDKNATE